MPRPYTKKDDAYWSRHSRPVPAPQQIVVQAAAAPASDSLTFKPVPFPTIAYGGVGSSGGGAPIEYRGQQLNNGLGDPGAFQNLKSMVPPYMGWGGGRDYVGCSDAISLCVKAWAGVPVCKNAVEVPVEFSSQPLYVKSSNDTVQTFFSEWLKAIGVNDLKEQYFRGYYREGNVFIYSFLGQFGPAYYGHFQNAFGSKSNRVPIRYEILNPANVFVPAGLSFPYTYVRMLSTWECERLRNPMTPQDKQVFDDLPPEAKSQIMAGGALTEGIYFNMDPKRLRFSFFKRQGYEPLGIPMLWPVLPDVEWKLCLKKMDKALARTIDHAILLVTNGEAPSKENGGNGINQNNIARLQALLSNQTVGRVLVADYTTKAQWLVPPIQEILGPEKYQIVNEDIREGLQSVLTGDDKFANAQIKAKIFVQRLEEGQRRFLDDFLMPEVRMICDQLGFRSVPDIGFTPIDLQDETVLARVYTQLAQIGILTAEQTVDAIKTQVLPDKDEMRRGQEEYKKQREKGLYEPLIGGQKDDGTGGGANGRPSGTKGISQTGTRKSGPIGTSKASTETAFSISTYTDCLRESEALAATVESALRKRHKIKGPFTEAQERVAAALARTIVSTQPRGQWVESVAATLLAPPVVSAEVGRELDDISVTFEVSPMDAALLRHCRTTAPTAEPVAA